MPPDGEPVELEKYTTKMRANFAPWLVLLIMGIATLFLGLEHPQLKIIFLKKLKIV